MNNKDIKFEVSLDVLQEMAECIHDCSWVSSDEVYAYMKSILTSAGDYDPDDWSEDGRGEVAIDRDSIIEQATMNNKQIIKLNGE